MEALNSKASNVPPVVLIEKQVETTKSTKIFVDTLSYICDILLSQLLKFCLKGDILAIEIPKISILQGSKPANTIDMVVLFGANEVHSLQKKTH